MKWPVARTYQRYVIPSTYLNIHYWINEKDTEWTQLVDDVLVHGGYCPLIFVQDETHSRADRDTNEEYCDAQYVVHPGGKRGKWKNWPYLENILVGPRVKLNIKFDIFLLFNKASYLSSIFCTSFFFFLSAKTPCIFLNYNPTLNEGKKRNKGRRIELFMELYPLYVLQCSLLKALKYITHAR